MPGVRSRDAHELVANGWTDWWELGTAAPGNRVTLVCSPTIRPNQSMSNATKIHYAYATSRTGREYNRDNPTCIHYDLKLKVSLRGAGKKRGRARSILLNKSGVVLAPCDL